MKKILNIGCGEVKIERTGFEVHNLDYVKRNQKNFKIHNLNFPPYPYKNNEFDVIIMNDVLEHLVLYDRNKEYWIDIFRELCRILKPKGILEIRTPHFASCSYLMEHHQLFSTGDFYMKFGGKRDLWHSEMLKGINFEIAELKITFQTFHKWIGWIFNLNQNLHESYDKYFSGIIRAKDIEVKLRKTK